MLRPYLQSLETIEAAVLPSPACPTRTPEVHDSDSKKIQKKFKKSFKKSSKKHSNFFKKSSKKVKKNKKN